MDLGTKRDTVTERAVRKLRGKEKEKARGRKARRKGERKARERATAGKERETGGTSIMIRGGRNRSVVTVVTVGNGVTRRPSALNGRGVVRWNLVQWCHILHRLVSDPGSSVSQRVQAVNSSPVSPVCWSESAEDEEDWPDEWWHDLDSDWTEDWQNGTTMRVPNLVCGDAGSNPS